MPEAAEDAPKRGVLSPVVRKLADEHGLDLSQVTGTGEGGRITRKDVMAFIDAAATKVAVEPERGGSGPALGALHRKLLPLPPPRRLQPPLPLPRRLQPRPNRPRLLRHRHRSRRWRPRRTPSPSTGCAGASPRTW